MKAQSTATTAERLDRLASLLVGRRTLVLSGAGISTESGIPDYRSPERLKRPRKPMLYQTFVSDELARRRYWARSVLGWQTIEGAVPNAGHQAVARLEAQGVSVGVITQNVDSLHQKAGSSEVLELHGSLSMILCLGCRTVVGRRALQRRLLDLNPDVAEAVVTIAPDGDSDVPDDLVTSFIVPECESCGGILKPHVVFFGENVPKERVVHSNELLARAQVLMVVGSSLAVMSGMRFVLAALRHGKQVVIINDGPTRADEQATFKLEGRLGEVLPALAALLA
ncbi:MAG: NAD-dependent protein deacetylase [Trueperaceae bacterium]